jgi:hypothetical protein
MKVTYELHVLAKGRWNIDRVYDGTQKQEAIEHARYLYAEPHITGVKVVCETYNENINQASEVVVFTAVPREPQAKPKPQKPVHKPARQPKQTGAIAGHQPKRKKKPPSTAAVAGLSFALVAAVVVLGFALTRGAEIISALG